MTSPAPADQSASRIPSAEEAAAGGADDALQPKVGDRVMVLRQPWLRYILDGRKTMEVRSRRYRPGVVWLGCDGYVYSQARITEIANLSAEEFRALEAKHCWPAKAALPFAKLVGLKLADVRPLDTPLPYWCPESAIGWHVYRADANDLPVKGASRIGHSIAGIAALCHGRSQEMGTHEIEPQLTETSATAPREP